MRFLRAMLAVCVLNLVLAASYARAQFSVLEPGFSIVRLSDDFAKQIELSVGPDSCLYYGSIQGLKRRCGPNTVAVTETICDSTLLFPVGIAFSTGGAFGSNLYVADYAANDLWRAPGCSPTTHFATLNQPGAIAFPPSGSAYGDFLYACSAFGGPISRVSSTGTVTPWVTLPTAYLRFGPGGAWTRDLYATDYSTTGAIDRVSSTGVVTPVIASVFFPEGFDWAFDGDLFVTSPNTATVYRAHTNGTTSPFATVPGAADVAYLPSEDALYVVSNQGGLYRITRGAALDAPVAAGSAPPVVSPNPARGACTLRFTAARGGLQRGEIYDASGRLVRALPSVWRPAGADAVLWDGRDAAGVPVRPGEYFVRVASAAEAWSGRVTVVR